jgi:cell division protein FtsI (penicillin-binding protein 3)
MMLPRPRPRHHQPDTRRAAVPGASAQQRIERVERPTRNDNNARTDRGDRTQKLVRPKAQAPWRAWLVAALLMSGLVLMVWKAGRLQLLLGGDLRTLAEGQYLRDVPMSAARGRIVDVHGKPLAITVPVQSIFAEPARVGNVAQTAQALAPLLQMDAAQVVARLNSTSSFVWLQRRPSPEVSDAVAALKLDGIGFRKEWRRVWPNKELLGSLLGSVDLDGVGRGGIEQAMNEALQSKSMRVPAVADNRGDRVAMVDGLNLDLLAGDDVVLTIDSGLQQHAEQVLHDTIAQLHAKAAWALVMDARTGAVLSVAQAPAHNPNDPDDGNGSRNRGLSQAFEPGSIFKVATFAAAFDAGVLRPDEMFDCENGAYRLGKHIIHDTHPASMLSAREVFSHSSNIGTLKIGRTLGEERLRASLQRYGFGVRPGIGMIEEASGRLPNQAHWGDARTATVSFGHGVLVSALQIASLVQAVANEGVQSPPHLVHAVRVADGNVLSTTKADGHRIMSAATARTMTDVMTAVTKPGGTGTLAAIAGIEVAGKTGTAEKVDPHTGRYSRTLNTSSFVGFAPADAPRLVAIVVVDEPQGQHTGGMTAAPAWKRIMEQALVVEGVVALGSLVDTQKPAEPGADADDSEASRPTIVTVDVALAHADLSQPVPVVHGPSMPNVVGMPLRQALDALHDIETSPELKGHGVVVAQEPAAGLAVTGERVQLVLTPLRQAGASP